MPLIALEPLEVIESLHARAEVALGRVGSTPLGRVGAAKAATELVSKAKRKRGGGAEGEEERLARLSEDATFLLGLICYGGGISLNLWAVLPSALLFRSMRAAAEAGDAGGGGEVGSSGRKHRVSLRHARPLFALKLITLLYVALLQAAGTAAGLLTLAIRWLGEDEHDATCALGTRSVTVSQSAVLFGVALLGLGPLIGLVLRALWVLHKLRWALLSAAQLHVTFRGGPHQLDDALALCHAALLERGDAVGGAAGAGDGGGAGGARFETEPQLLVSGRPLDAALGVHDYLGASDEVIFGGLARGVAAVVDEFEAHGSEEERALLAYVLHGATGDWQRGPFSNGTIDEGRPAGLRLADFVAHASSRLARLRPAHILALRLYTTAAFRSLNAPLRDRARTAAHPFSVTIALVADGVRRLRAVGGEAADAHAPLDLWRGMRDVRADDDFLARGGTELAPCSTTLELEVAARYCASARPLLFKLQTSSFMERGADLQFLSAFPGEAEYLFPPLTYMKPTGRRQTCAIDGGPTFTVIEVTPHFGS